MSRAVVTLSPADDVAQARQIFRDKNIHHLIVAQNERVVGIVSYREIAGKPDHQPLGEIMTRDFTTGAPWTTLREAAALMLRHSSGCLPILDRGIVGILTTTDLVRNLGRTRATTVSA